jgi:histidine kinase
MNNLSMLKSEEMVFKPQNVSMEDILVYTCDEMKYMAYARDQELVYDFQEGPHPVYVDIDKTTMAFGNLLDNAIRFSPQGSRIRLAVTQDGPRVVSWVQDEGVGIPPDKLQKIFEEFYQIEPPNTRRYGGLGIGLTIAKGLIEAQGGKIWAESDGLGNGATFKVSLPTA